MLRPIIGAVVLVGAALVSASASAQGSAQERPPALVEAPRSQGAALFSDELTRLEGALAAWLAERSNLSVDLLPASTRATFEAPVCAAPMGAEDVVRLHVGRAARVHSTARCNDDGRCKLVVRISRPPLATGAWELLHMWEATVLEGAGRIERFVAAVPRLTEASPNTSGSLLGSLRRSSAELVTIFDVDAAGHFRSTPTPATVAAAIQNQLDACAEEGWPTAVNERAVLAFGRDGRTARCESVLRNAEHGDVASGRATCLCNAFSHLRVERGPAGRRIEVDFMNHTSSMVLAGDLEHGARFEATAMTGGFRAHPGFSRVRRPIAQCFAMAGVTTLTRAPVRIVVDGSGTLTRAEIGGAQLTPEVSRCLQSVFRTLAFACPVNRAEATWTGELIAYTRQP